MNDAPKVIDLFAGCGGMSCGLLEAGYDVRLGVDNYPAAVQTFSFNHGHVGAHGWVADLRFVSGDHLRQVAGLTGEHVDLLTGGPPCQPFSIIGKRQALRDARGDLVFEYVRLLEEVAPSAFIFENVANFARVEGGMIAEKLVDAMERAGYAVTFGVLNAAEYGVPQMRKRFFIVGVRGANPSGFPPATHGPLSLLGLLPVRTSRDALDELPDVDTPDAMAYFNHEGTSHSPAMIKMLENLQPGTRDPKSHHDRLHPDRPAYTLRAGFGNYSPLRPIHYRYPRVISVRESARIQTFPDHFVWPHGISRLQQYRQVGNAVPPLLARRLGEHLAQQMGWFLDADRFSRVPERSPLDSALSPEERIAERRRFIRGASVGRLA